MPNFDDPFFQNVAGPILAAWKSWKTMKGRDRFAWAQGSLTQCAATDWQRACNEWIGRRLARWEKKQQS